MLIDAAGLRAYIGAILSETEAGGVMEMPVFGSSMAPFLIHGRDAVRLVKCTYPPKRGEIVLFRRLDGQYVLQPRLARDEKRVVSLGRQPDRP